MWLTPRSIAFRSTAIDLSRSLGVPWWKAALPVSRIAPNPSRLMVRSPSVQVPAACAVIVCEVIDGVSHGPRAPSPVFYGYVYLCVPYGYVYVFRVATAEA